jgi:hypothetical protein
MPALEDFVYGFGRKPVGLLVDNIGAFEDAGGALRETPTGRTWAMLGNRAYPITCGDIVQEYGEDGPYTARCGLIVAPGKGACEGHAAQQEEWLAMSEAEKVAWEMEREEWGY